MHHDVGAIGRRRRRGECHTERARDGRPLRVDVDELDDAAGDPAGDPGDQAADGSSADHGHAIADVRPRVPQPVDRGLHVRRQHRSRRRHVIGQDRHRSCRHDVSGLMREQREHAPPLQIGGAALDRADAGVAVLHRRRKRAFLKRRPHAVVLAHRHAAVKHERFSPAAHAAEQRAHHDLIRRRRGQRLAADLAAPRRRNPEGARFVCNHVDTITELRTLNPEPRTEP